MHSTKKTLVLLSFAAAGGAVGYWLFGLALARGMVPLALPGGLMGIAAGFRRGPSWIWPSIICGVSATLFGALCYWKFLTGAQYPFTTFLVNPGDLPQIHLILLALGGFIGFWIPFRRREKQAPAA